MASSESSRPTPLGVARARFVDGLARKSQELRGSLALLAATPHEERPREELRRRLHALYASAQVFQLEALAAALKDGIVRLDQAREDRVAVSQDDLDALASLAATLPLLGSHSPASDPAIIIPAAAPIPLVTRTSTGPVAPPPERSTYPGPAVVPVAASPQAKVPLPERSISRPPLVENELQFGRAPADAKPAPAPELKQKLAGSILERPIAPRSARPPVVSVLVLDGAEVVSRARSILPSDRFEVLGAADPEEALRLARSSSPDVVLVDQLLLASRADFLRRLRDDPLTDFVPVVAMSSEASFDPVRARELGALDAVKKPLEAGTLEPVLVRLGLGEGPRDPSGLGGDLTIEEIAGRVAEEIRRGLVESADEGRDLSVPVGDGAEILAATWAAIGRMRAHLAVRSGGRVHFREKGSGPAFLALTDEDAGTEDHVEVSLRDRHVIVVDDDPAVVWFFAGLLREAGAVVEEAHDGLEALELARRVRPDVIISDILMPGIDGFALLRELQRDPVLADVPVILLSWKEDFLQRMRELQSGASGYLRKEAGAAQILASVRDVLRPRARLESRLRAGGEVRGRLARVGPIALLKTVAQLRPNARVTVRDAWNLFEIDLREVEGDHGGKGQLVDVTRTASDGSFSRGPRVVPSLLGATEGRFTVSDADAAVRGSVKEPLDSLLAHSAALLGGVVQAVSGKHLAHAYKVELDPDVLASVTRASPAHVTEVVDLLGEGHGPRALLLEGRVAPQVLEGVLVDLARQGAIVGVSGERGEDRIELARKERGETEIPTRTPSLAPPKRAPAGGTTPGLGAVDPSTLPTSPGDLLVSEDPTPTDLPAPDMAWLKTEETTGNIVLQAMRPEEEIIAEDRASRRPPASAPEASAPEAAEPEAAPKAAALPVVAEPEPRTEPKTEQKKEAPATDARPRLKNTVVGMEARAPQAKVAPVTAKPAPRLMDGPLPWIAGIALCALTGYVGYQAVHTEAAAPDGAGSPIDTAVTPPPDAPVDVPVDAPPPPPPRLVMGFGVEEPGVAVAVGEGQGVLLFEGGTGALRAHITREDGSAEGEVMLASDDVTVVVAEGVYGVTFEAGEDLTVRFTRVAAGTTRRLPRP